MAGVKHAGAQQTADLFERLAGDSPESEQAFEALRAHIKTLHTKIYNMALRERNAQRLGYFVELLGESGMPKYLSFIREQLRSEHNKVRFSAYVALLRLGTPASRALHYSCNLRQLLSGRQGQ